MIPWDDIDPEIHELVGVLNRYGFQTHHSCCGHRLERRHSHSAAHASVGLDVHGLKEQHRFVAALNVVAAKLDAELWFDVRLNWREDVAYSLDADQPRRIPLELLICELGSKRSRDKAPTTEQLRRVAVEFAAALGRPASRLP